MHSNKCARVNYTFTVDNVRNKMVNHKSIKIVITKIVHKYYWRKASDNIPTAKTELSCIIKVWWFDARWTEMMTVFAEGRQRWWLCLLRVDKDDDCVCWRSTKMMTVFADGRHRWWLCLLTVDKDDDCVCWRSTQMMTVFADGRQRWWLCLGIVDNHKFTNCPK